MEQFFVKYQVGLTSELYFCKFQRFACISGSVEVPNESGRGRAAGPRRMLIVESLSSHTDPINV